MNYLEGFGPVGAWAALLGTLIQLVDAVQRGSLRAELKDQGALTDLTEEQLPRIPIWQDRARRRARQQVQRDLLTGLI